MAFLGACIASSSRQAQPLSPVPLAYNQYHVFNSAVCIGTLLIRDPRNVLAGFILSQIDSAIVLFSMLVHAGNSGFPSSRPMRNLQWLIRLRSRVCAKMTSVTSQPDGGTEDSLFRSEHSDTGEDVELLGWRTRLIERASQTHHTAKTIQSTATASVAQSATGNVIGIRSDVRSSKAQSEDISEATPTTSGTSAVRKQQNGGMSHLPSTGGDLSDMLNIGGDGWGLLDLPLDDPASSMNAISDSMVSQPHCSPQEAVLTGWRWLTFGTQ